MRVGIRGAPLDEGTTVRLYHSAREYLGEEWEAQRADEVVPAFKDGVGYDSARLRVAVCGAIGAY